VASSTALPIIDRSGNPSPLTRSAKFETPVQCCVPRQPAPKAFVISASVASAILLSPIAPRIYGAKYPEMSRIKCAGLEPKALTEPLVVGTIAMFEVIEPSMAFNVDTKGCVAP
jgi:hypothetical protein